MLYECIEFEIKHYKSDNLIVLKTQPNKLQRFFGIKSKVIKFIGSRTIWYSFPEWKRQSTSWESFLSDFNEKLMYKEYLKDRKKKKEKDNESN